MATNAGTPSGAAAGVQEAPSPPPLQVNSSFVSTGADSTHADSPTASPSYDLPWTSVELKLLWDRQLKAAAKSPTGAVPDAFKLRTVYGLATIKDLRRQVVDGADVTHIVADLPFGRGYLTTDAVAGNPIRFKPGDKVSTPFGPAHVVAMRLDDDIKMYEVNLVAWMLSDGTFPRAVCAHTDVGRRWEQTFDEMVATVTRLKLKGNAGMKEKNFDAACVMYQQGTLLADKWIEGNKASLERVPEASWPLLFHVLAMLRSNCAQAMLKLPSPPASDIVVNAESAKLFLQRRVLPHFKAAADKAKEGMDGALAAAKGAGVTAATAGPEGHPLLTAVRAAKAVWDGAKVELEGAERMMKRTMMRLGQGFILMKEYKAAVLVLTDHVLTGEQAALKLAHKAKAAWEAQKETTKATMGGFLSKPSPEAPAPGVPPQVAGQHPFAPTIPDGPFPPSATAATPPQAPPAASTQVQVAREAEEGATTSMWSGATPWLIGGAIAAGAAIAGAALYSSAKSKGRRD